MSKPNQINCPACYAGTLSFHDTNHRNESDQGTGKPYFMCSDQEVCGFIVSVWNVDKLRKIYRKVKTNELPASPP